MPDAPIALAAALLAATVAIARVALGFPALAFVRLYLGITTAAVLAVTAAGLAAAVFGARRRRRGPVLRAYGDAWIEVWSRHATRGRGAAIALGTVAAALSLAALTSGRQLIPILHPYDWDPTLDLLDRSLLGGRAAWELASFARAQWMVVLYNPVWLLVVLGSIAAAVVAPPSPNRSRFLVAGVLNVGVLGVMLAVMLSSAGPLYFDPGAEKLGPSDAVAQALEAAGLADVAHGQAEYWRIGQRTFGVTAMPSMHVAQAATIALAAWRWRRWAGVLAGAYAIAIVIGSVALGWHYASDSVVSTVGAWALWALAGRLVEAPPAEHRASSGERCSDPTALQADVCQTSR